MNVIDAQAICRDFSPVRNSDGKVQCRSLLQAEVCSLPTHFRCELLIHRDREEVEKRRRLPMLSVSRVNLIEECPRKFALAYVHKATPPVDQNWKVVGSNFAIARAKIDSGQPWAVPNEPDPYSAAKLRAILLRYEKEPRPQVDNEVEVSTTIQFEGTGKYTVRGFLDAASKDRTRIIEWKYAAREYDRLSIARQASIYFACVPEAKELVLSRARKPSHRPQKNELPGVFESRVAASFEDRSPFEHKTYLREEFDVENELRTLVQRFEMAEKYRAIGYPPSYRACGDCDFHDFCIEHMAKGIGCSDPKCSHPRICSRIKETR